MIRLVRLTLALVALAAIAQQLFLQIKGSHSVLNFFSYFTNLSNLFAALVLLLSVCSGNIRSRDVVRYVSTVNTTIVGLVFVVLLRNESLGGLLPWVNFVLHFVMPVGIVLDWLCAPPASQLERKHVLFALLFPAGYLGYTISRGASTGWYPYPFLNPVSNGGYGGVAAYSVGLALTFLAISLTLHVVGNRLTKAKLLSPES